MRRESSRSLRATYLSLIVLVISVALAVSAALVVMTNRIHETTVSLAAAVEGVRLAEEVEIELLLHDPVALARGGPGSTARLQANLDGARRHVTTAEEAAALIETVADVDAYVASARAGARGSVDLLNLRDDAIAAAQRLIEINVRQAEEASARATRWDVLANYVGFGAGALLLLVTFLVPLWLRARAFQPLHDVARAIEAYRRGDRGARAEEVGPLELREIASQFNRMAVALEEQRTAQMTFLGGVAHDLRNPLAALRLAVSTLARGGSFADSRACRTLEVLDRQLTHLERMVGDFLDISRIEAGSLELRLELHDLRALVERAAAPFKHASARHPLALHLPPEAVPVACDPLRVEQVVVNLVSNAIKYSPAGGPVAVSVARAGEEAVVSVRDEGVGVSDADRGRLFDPFFRAGLSREAIPGAGLGLYVVRKIAHAHDGRIEVDSAIGRGSTFRVVLPVATGAGERPRSTGAIVPEP